MAALMQHSSGSPPANGASSVSRIPFPQAPEDFPRDQRVSFSKLEQKWILEDDDSSEWEYDEARQRWIPLVGLFMTTTLKRSMSWRLCN